MHTLPAINYEIPKEVDQIYFTLGYRFKYIPYILAKDIANVMSHWKLTGNSSGFVGGKTKFNNKYKEFLYSIPFDLYRETTPYYMAVEIIKDLSSKYDFRKMEKAIIIENDDFSFDKTVSMDNPLIDIEELDSNIIETLNIDINNHISLNVINILKETEKFNKLFSNSKNTEVSRMTSYNQINKISKYKLKLPTFDYKYTLKNYQINQGAPKEIVIFRDVSKSAESMDKIFKGLLLYFMQSFNGRIITIHEFTNKIVNTYYLKSIEDIKNYYRNPTKYYISFLKFLPNYIKGYSECYIVSKGTTDVYPKTLNCIVNGISKGHNESLKILSHNTKGHYINI